MDEDKQLKDHKQIGQEMELFFTNDMSPGAVYWLPKGMVIFKELERYIRELTENAGYLETSTPIMVKNGLFEKSGHWAKFGAHNMYNLSIWEDEELRELSETISKSEDKIKDYVIERLKVDKKAPFPFYHKIGDYHGVSLDIQILNYDPVKGVMWTPPVNYSLKPMNCPESTILYRFKPRSYKELPLRLMEIGRLHRREKAGEVNGLLRVRQLTMDDAHIFAAEDQIFDEVSSILDMMISFYKHFGFEYEFRFATRPEIRAGTDQMWDEAEEDLIEVLKKKGIRASDKKGDGAFYGPKIDVHIKDAHGREWQLATVQLDFSQPEAFELKYTDRNGEQKTPVMIHRAIFGSFERFTAILTENFQGAFPTWLSPVQVKIIPIADRHNEYGQKLLEQLKDSGIRSEADDRSEKMQAKIRGAQGEKIPYMLILGDKEEQENKVSVRKRSGESENMVEFLEFLDSIKAEIAERS